jgi:elongation factor P hydroxylase
MHCVQDLIRLFNAWAKPNHQTELVLGGDEPIYLPATPEQPWHQIVFAHGYFSSALHEISHWCIAGAKRRQLVDYGYWYEPDGRCEQQQQAFEQVEVKPQALEWLMALACGVPFEVSCDNLNGSAPVDRFAFQDKVSLQVLAYLEHGLPPRAQEWIETCRTFYQTDVVTCDTMPAVWQYRGNIAC